MSKKDIYEILQKQFVMIEKLERKMWRHHKRCYQLYTLRMEIEICSYCMSFITEITDIKQEIRNTILKERREVNND